MSNQWQACVNVKWKVGAPATAWECWKGNDSVKSAWSCSGDWDCSLWVDVHSPEELEQFVWNQVRNNDWVVETNSVWVKKWW